jgi:hypothetical protein
MRPLEDAGTDGKAIITCIFKKLYGNMDWTDLAQNRNKWQALANKVTKLLVQLIS